MNEALNDQIELNEDKVETAPASKPLYISLRREQVRLVPLAFTMPDDLRPIPVDGFTISWTKEALATFSKMLRDIRSTNPSFLKNLPYAWLRGSMEVSLQNILRIEPRIGLNRDALTTEVQNQPKSFVYLDGGDKRQTRVELTPLLDDWIAQHLIPYAEREGVLPETINQLQKLHESSELLSIDPFQSQALPWSWSDQTGTTKPQDRYSFHILVDYVARQIAGQEIFQRLGSIKRIITSRSGITSGLVELITDPIPLSEKGLFSLVVRLEVVTFPSLHQPLLTIDVSKRRWLNSLAENSFDRQAISGYVFSHHHLARAFSYQLTRKRNRDNTWQWKPDTAFEVLRRKLQLPTQIFDGRQIVRGEASTDICQVMLTYREGIRDKQQKHGIEKGVPEVDKLEAFDAIAQILAPIGLKPFGGYSLVTFGRGQSHITDDTASRTINAPTLLGATLQTLETGGRVVFTPRSLAGISEDLIDNLLRRHFQIGLAEIQQIWNTVRFSAKNKEQTSELQELIAANQEAIRLLYPNERPLLVIFYENGTRDELKILEAVIRVLWGNVLDIGTNPLPANTHGPRAGLLGKELDAAGRAQKRREAWNEIVQQIAALNRRTFCLVMANEFYSDPNNSNAIKHDDIVNKPSTRQALAAIAGSCVQFIRPPQKARKTGTIDLCDFFYRIQEATKDLLSAHSGRIDGICEKVDLWLDDILPEARPKEILGITIVRKNRGRARQSIGTTFLPIAIRIEVETGKCEMCCAYEQGDSLKISPWQYFPDAISTISQISPVRLAENMNVAKTRFMRFVEQIISASVEDEKNPLVIIDSSNCARLWPWLTDQKIDVTNIDIGEHQWMQDTWQGARIIRIRQDLAPNIIEDKVQILAESFLEDPRLKHFLSEDIKVSTPSSQITGLLRLKTINQTGCVVYLSLRHDGTNREKRGLSCYRETRVAREVKKKVNGKFLLFFLFNLYQKTQNDRSVEAGKLDIWFIRLAYHLIREKGNDKWRSIYNEAGLKLHTLETLQPYVDMWSTPNPLEIVVTLRQEGDNPDRLAALVESLRYGFGHYSEWTTLPAPLFFERVVRDYISAFALEDDDAEAESKLESGD